MAKLINKICLVFLIAAFVILSFSLSSARELSDEIGRKVIVIQNPGRIISLAPGITETLYALGLADKIVGVTTFCDWPEDARRKERVGGFTNPSIEKIVSLKPDIILATADGNRKETVLQLERLGLPVYVINPADAEGILKSILRVGEVTDEMPAAKSLVIALRKRLNSMDAQIKNKKKPRVFFQIGLEPVISAGAGTLINEAMERAGAFNVAGQSVARYPRYSAEGIAASQPDIILIAPMSGDKEFKASKKFWNKLSMVPAVKNGRIYFVDTDLISRASPRIIDAIEHMALIFHPEIKIGK
jgi:iron complex transport system substrate-binding protein